MMNKKFTLALAAIVLLWPAKTSSSRPPENSFHVSSTMDFTDEQLEVAKQVEKEMRDHGFSDELITGAIVNAYAESKLDPDAVGLAGERGVFQLNPRGMGKGMHASEMRDVRISVNRVARAIKKNKKIMQMEASGASSESHVRAFCIEIENPDNKVEKAENRVRLMRKILK